MIGPLHHHADDFLEKVRKMERSFRALADKTGRQVEEMENIARR